MAESALDILPLANSTFQGVARLTVENLSKVFTDAKGAKIHALQDLSLTVEDKELLVLVGPSGCGKTTTLRLIAGLEEPGSGAILLDGQNQSGLPAEKRDIAMVFQNPALFPQLNVFENIGLGLKLRKVPGAEIRQRVTETSEMLGLTSCLVKRPGQLSGGEQQRVALARAIVRRPRLFLLDEPLSSLDPPLRAQMRSEIARIQRQIGITMIFVTHDQTDALTLGNRIAVLRAGQVQQVAPPSTLYAAPANRFVAGFIGFPPMSFLTGTILEASNGLVFQFGKSNTEHTWQVPILKPHRPKLLSQAKREVILGVRPEDVEIVASGEGQGAVLPATVEWIEALGGENIIHLRAQEHLLRMRSFDSHSAPPKIGEKLMLRIRMERVLYFDPESGVALR